MDHTPEDDATRVQSRTLTPAEVHNIAFKKPTIGRRGYDEEEVDNFLDIVEGELVRLIEDNDRLKNAATSAPLDASQLSQVTDQDLIAENKRLSEALAKTQEDHAASLNQLRGEHANALGAAQQAQGDLGNSQAQLQEALRAAEQRALQAEQAASQAQQEAAAAKEAAANATSNSGAVVSADHHTQAVKVLALAQQTADQHLAGAQAEADKTVKDAQEQAARLHQESTSAADRRVNEAQSRADAIKADTEARATKTIQDAETHAKNVNDALESRKGALEGRLSELGTFEREYRSRLKSYLESQLRDLEHGGSDDAAAPADTASQN